MPLRNTYRIELSLIEPDPNQPRQHFDADALQELADSIKARDVRQPLSVRWEPTSRRYRIIDGERRFRAAKQAGMQDVPCIVTEGEGKEVLVDQIVQNWQRADLRPYETADALVRLKQEFAMSISDIAAMTGKSVGEVSKLIALVERVAPEVQERVRQLADASLTKRHLYALTQLEPHQQMRLAQRIEREQLTGVFREKSNVAETAWGCEVFVLHPAVFPGKVRRLDPLREPIFLDHHGHWQSLANIHPTAPFAKPPVRLRPSLAPALPI